MAGRAQLAVLKSLVQRRVQQRVSILRPGERSPSEPAGAPRSGDRSSEIREKAVLDAASKEKNKFFFLASDEIQSLRFSSSHGEGEEEARRRLTVFVKEAAAALVAPESQAASRDWSLGSWNAPRLSAPQQHQCFLSAQKTTRRRSDLLGFRAYTTTSVAKGEEAVAEEIEPRREQGQGGDEGVSASVSNQVELIKPRRRSRRKKQEEKALEIQPEEQGTTEITTTAVKAKRKPRTSHKVGLVLEDEVNRLADSNVQQAAPKRQKPVKHLKKTSVASSSIELGDPNSSVKHVGLKKTPAASSSTELGGLESSVDVLPAILGEISDNELEVQNFHNCALEEVTEILGHTLGLPGIGSDCLSEPQAGTSPVEELVHQDTLNLTQFFTEVPEEVSKQAVSTEEDLHSVFPPSKQRPEIFSEDSIQEMLENHEYGDLKPRVAPKFPKVDVMRAGKASPQGESGNDENEKTVKVPIPPQYSDPRQVFSMLHQSKPSGVSSFEKARFSWIFHRFAESGWVSDQALAIYINSKFFPTAVSRFRKFFSSRSSSELRAMLIKMGPTNEALRFLFPIFAEFCINEFAAEISRYRDLVSTADLTKPDAWYPFARAMKRKVIYHQGPTNSGKTYVALQRFMKAANGIYCSPLRLLAMEVFDKVNAEGVYCNLHTGQEKKDVPFANHLTCTVEMSYLNRQWEVAVIDEIQMMSDEYRGWAWTRAFLGLQADEIHVCGDPSAVPLLHSLCAATGDELVQNDYERFKPLTIDHGSLNGDFANVEAGDCIVAFSRKDIFDVKREVELATKHRCCVVYGALPPETRRQQAKLFNDPDSGYDVLVASDAVGMGLNLNIRRVVFYSLDKFDGGAKRPVPPSQVKQIAGRAGRRGSLFPEGITTTFFSKDSVYLSESMQQGFENATSAGLFPVYEQVELFASQLPEMSLSQLLERFAETCRLDGAYFLCRYDNLKRVASVLDKVKGLSLEDRFNFCFAPVNVRDPQSLGALYRYALAYSQKIPVVVQMGAPVNSARDEFELMDLETRHQVLSMYLWLSQHFREEQFVQKGRAEEMATHIATLLGQSLVQSSGRWHDKHNGPQSRKPGRHQSPRGKVAFAMRPGTPQISKKPAKQERVPAAC